MKYWFKLKRKAFLPKLLQMLMPRRLVCLLSSRAHTRVSNGTEFSCPAGQQDRSPFIVPGQRDGGTRFFFYPRTKGTGLSRDVLPARS